MSAELSTARPDDTVMFRTALDARSGEPQVDLRQIQLTLIVPAYNEQRTLDIVVRSLLDVDLPCRYEVVVVDDGSKDRTPDILRSLTHPDLRTYRHEVNQGKGAAVRTALSHARGSYVLIFDADLEYSPDDISLMLAPVLSGQADVVFGKRPLGLGSKHQGLRFLLGNLTTTAVARLLYRSQITDLHTCFKLAPRELLLRMPLSENGFGLDTQIAVGVLRSGQVVHEVPITYQPRSRADGKKIGWRDGVRCLVLLVKYRFTQAVAPMPIGVAVAAAPLHTFAPDGDLGAQPLVPAQG